MKNLMLVLILSFSAAVLAADLEDDAAAPQEAESQALTPDVDVEDISPSPQAKPEVAQAPKKKRAGKEEPDASKEDAGDTYNFYFQKGSGPGSVEQGGSQRVQGEGSSKTDQKEDDAFSKFEGHLGLIVTPTSSGTGLSLGGQFNATRKFGLQVHLVSLQTEEDGDNSSSFSASGTEDKETKVSSIGGSVGAVFTPVTLNERSMPVRLSLLGGLMLLSTSRTTTTDTFSARGSNETSSTEKESKAMAFAGVSATAKIADQFGLVGYAKVTTDTDYSQIGLSAAWLF